MNITRSPYYQYKSVSFEGLTRNLGKRAIVTPEEIIAEIEKYSKSKGIVGSIPKEWVEKIPQEKRGEVIKQLYAEFGTAISELRKNGQYEQSINNTSQKLTSALRKSGILSEHESVKLKKLTAGVHGTGYLMQNTGSDKKYVIKIFHTKDSENIYHGNYIEANRAMFWNKQMGTETDRPAVAFMDTKNGYALFTQLIDYKTPFPKKSPSPNLLGLKALDDGLENMIKGYSIDYGGLELNSPTLATNKTARYIYKKLYKTPKDQREKLFEEILNSKKTCNYHDKLIGLACGIDLLEFNQREIYFEQLLQNADKKLKTVLTEKLSGLPDGLPDKALEKCFIQLTQDADNELKLALTEKLSELPIDLRENCLTRLARGADNEFKLFLIKKLIVLPEEKIEKWFAHLAKGADNEAKKELAKQLWILPRGGDSRKKWFINLAEGADNEVKKELAERLWILPEEGNLREDWFTQFARDADDNLKRVLERILNLLSKEARERCKKQFNSN